MRKRVAVVTGSSLGIGRATAEAFARAGAAVALVSRDQDRGETAAKEIEASGAEAVFIPTDVAHEAQVRAMIHGVIDRFGRLDVLVNNAAVYLQGDVVETSAEDWNRILATNLTGAFLCTKYATPAMDAGGVVINVSSEAGLVGIGRQVAYNVSKGGLIAFTRSCAVDLAARGIRVNCVCPGTTDTPLVEEAVSRAPDPAGARRALEAARPLNRLGTPSEIASAILYLASDEAAYATGAVLSVDGGYTAQ
ncbi:MAG: SDR family NAD(P)-dependent oxidoreductase [Acidimicrobiia bacterium]